MFDKLKSFEYRVGIRKIQNDSLLYEDKTLLNEFVLIKNPFLYWMADPFVIEFDNQCFLFVEIGNKITGKGSLAFGKIDKNGRVKIQKISAEKFHMSFPNPYVIDNHIYILPETKKDRSLFFYEFNFKTQKIKKKKELLNNIGFVDSLIYDNYLFCYENNVDNSKLIIFEIDKQFKIVDKIHEIIDVERKFRAAGKIFKHNDKIIFPTQNCSNIYGGGLIFNDVTLKKERFESKIILEVTPEDVTYFLSKKAVGIHTYNKSKNYEVIDIRRKIFSFSGLIGKIFYKLRRKKDYFF